MLREPFEAWLTTATQPGGDDAQPGTVMVWRDRLDAVQHAAVTLGDGWALHKPSQGWMTPRVVLPVSEIKRAALQKGHRLNRRSIAPA
jgi:cell wall-associated NlpC family hydrolase